MTGITITGQDALVATLGKLGNSMQNKALRAGMKAGAAIVAKAAEVNLNAIVAKGSTGLLEKNVKVYVLKKKDGVYLRYGVMVKKGLLNQTKHDKNGPVRVGLYASVLEYRPGKSWLRKAARETTGQVVAAVRETALAKIDDAIQDAKK